MTLASIHTPDDEIGRYAIGEVVERTGLTAHTLRWYERIGLMTRVSREVPRSGRDRAGPGKPPPLQRTRPELDGVSWASCD